MEGDPRSRTGRSARAFFENPTERGGAAFVDPEFEPVEDWLRVEQHSEDDRKMLTKLRSLMQSCKYSPKAW